MNYQRKLVLIFFLNFIILFSCEDNSKILNEINIELQEPVGIANQIKMIYTDSTEIKAILTAPKHLDYTNLSFQYSIFPKGLKVDFFDELGNKNEAISDYGILYNSTKILDLKGNVILKSYNGSELITNQLFWDIEKEWLFTEKFFTFQDSSYDFQAYRLDTNKEFTKFQTGELVGKIIVNDSIDK
ncbi:MAG: LPS export ABC transporter periplasmic protein LptC [Flavobacteriaceae bacterium]|nr:LPS export ABC transporter periplasmic protein LptC [Flavobacteriaceae bacterium]|tara:strand:+ start:1143 stop:1700 length:558 start_codon:yes stop_codon:yes gene_type:complete